MTRNSRQQGEAVKLTRKCLDDLQALEELTATVAVADWQSQCAVLDLRRDFERDHGLTVNEARTQAQKYARQSVSR